MPRPTYREYREEQDRRYEESQEWLRDPDEYWRKKREVDKNNFLTDGGKSRAIIIVLALLAIWGWADREERPDPFWVQQDQEEATLHQREGEIPEDPRFPDQSVPNPVEDSDIDQILQENQRERRLLEIERQLDEQPPFPSLEHDDPWD